MHKNKWGAILLVAGTCIGSGMIALPMVLAKLGLVYSILLMLFIWFIMYYTSLVNLELNLQAGKGLSLGSLGRLYSGKGAEVIGTLSLKVLSYALLAVFIYGASSILQQLLGLEGHFKQVALAVSCATLGMLLLPMRWIDYGNRILFLSLLGVVALLIGGLALAVNWAQLPLWPTGNGGLSLLTSIIPVVFTSFGFQVIFHTLTNYCHRHPKVLKQAFLWGSLIPAIVYTLWTASVLTAVYQENPQFFQKMATENVEVGTLVQVLSSISKVKGVQLLVWWISLLAIVTSIIGVGIGLCDTLNHTLSQWVQKPSISRIIASILAVIPAFLVVIWVPNAFIAALGFAGMILAIIAILLPIYLLKGIRWSHLHYPELRAKSLILLSLLVGIIVIASELFNMLY